MKKIILGIIILLSLSFIGVSAASSNINDEANLISDKDETVLEDVLTKYNANYHLNSLIITTTNNRDIASEATNRYTQLYGKKAGLVIAFNKLEDGSCQKVYKLFGKIANLQDKLTFDEFGNETYQIQDIYYQISLQLNNDDSNIYIKDMAHLLSPDEVKKLKAKASQFEDIKAYILTVYATDDMALGDFADNYYDSHEYSYDGVLLLIDMARNELYISTSGKGMYIFSDNDINDFGEELAGYLGNGDTYKTFDKYFSGVLEYIDDYKDTETFNSNNNQTNSTDNKPMLIVLASLGLGTIVGFIVGITKLGQLKTKRKVAHANKYIDKNSIVLSNRQDLYLYTTHTKVEKPKEDAANKSTTKPKSQEKPKNTSTHVSSSGRTHGGGGKKF